MLNAKKIAEIRKHLYNADFRKYYDTTQKRNYWVLGYFGGGAVTIVEALEVAKDYSDIHKVPLETVKIDEILDSRRYKGFKFVYSTEKQKQGEGIDKYCISDNVFAMLSA